MRVTLVVHQYLPRFTTGTEQYVHGLSREYARRGLDVDVVTLHPLFGPDGPALEEIRDTVDGVPVTRIRFWQEIHPDPTRREYRHPLLDAWFRRHLAREERPPGIVHFFHLRCLGPSWIDLAHEAGHRTIVNLMDFWFLCPAITLIRGDGSLCDGPPDGGAGCLPCIANTLGAPRTARDDFCERIARNDPAAARLRGTHPYLPALTERPSLLRAALLRAERIAAPSEFLRGVFAHNGIPAPRMEVVRYGIPPLPPFRRSPRSDSASLRIGFVGSITPHKGVAVLFEAFAQLTGPVELHVHGRLTDFEDYARPLIEQARDDSRIHLHGPFARDELGTVLAGIDVLAVPSLWYENTPFVVLEAQAARIPVVATDLGGLREILRDEVDGLLFERGDSAALARQLQRLTDAPELAMRMADNAPTVRSLEANADEFVSIYAKLQSSCQTTTSCSPTADQPLP